MCSVRIESGDCTVNHYQSKQYRTCTATVQSFFFQAEDGIRDVAVTGVQTCALPILTPGTVFRPRGMYVASVTPFRDDESLDLDRLATHLEDLVAAGVDGIVVLGGSGE